MPIHCPECGFEFPQGLAQLPSQCPRCGAPLLIPEAPIAQQPPRRQHGNYGFLRYSPTAWLIAVNVVMFLVTVAVGRSLNFQPDVLVRLGANYGPAVLSGQWWRLLTSTFLHGGVLHIAFNMWAFFNVGLLGEILYGRRNFVILYLLCGLGGSVASVWWHPNVLGVGASGAIFGIAGALLPALKFQKNPRVAAAMKGMLGSITMFVIYNLAFGAAVPHIDNAAHLGGLLTGVIAGALLPSYTVHEERAKTGRAVAVFAGVLVLLAVFGYFAHLRGGAAVEIEKGQQAVNAGDNRAAIDHFRRAVQLDPKLEQAKFMLAALLVQENRYSEALPLWQELVQRHPDIAKWQDTLCTVLVKNSDPQDAVQHCEKAVQEEPGNGDYLFNLGLVYRTVQRKDAAVSAFQKAYSLNPNGFDENYFLGLALLENGENQEAAVRLRQAVALNPKDEAAKQALADAVGK